MYLLDTNVVSEMRKQHRAHRGVQAWSASVDVSDLYLSVITVLELELGALLLADRDAAQAAVLTRWVHSAVMPGLAARVLPVDTAVALRCARLNVPDTRPYADSLIAATALVHAMTVVTRDVRHYSGTGVRILNPFDV